MLNRINSGLTRTAQGFRSSGAQANIFQNQLKAIGTTARYYLAGSLVFGIRSAINNLAAFKTELGQVNSLAAQSVGGQGKLQGLGSELQNVGTEALLMSNKFGIAVGDVETYMQRFFSSFNPSGTAKQRVQQMSTYVDAILKLTTALGSEAGDPQKLAGGLTGLINATPGGRQHPGTAAKHISDMFAQLLKTTPSLTGSDIASAAGRFSQAKSLAGMTVPQVLATFGVAAQTGGSPAVIIRGITQLLGASLLHPTRPASLQTYRQAGLPTDPNALHALGGQKVLERLITFVQAGHVPGQKGNMNLDAIYNAFSRQESVRQFVALLAQGGVPALEKFNKSLEDSTKQNISGQMADIRLRQMTLTRAQNASKNLGIGLLRAGQDPLEFFARGEIGLSNLVNQHQTATQVVGGGALSLGAMNALRRMGAFSKLSKGGKFGKFLSGVTGIESAAIGGAITSEELPSAIAGTAGDGSRAKPFWVIIAPLSWSLGGPNTPGNGGGGTTGPGLLRKIPIAAGGEIAAGVAVAAAGSYLVGTKHGRSILTKHFNVIPHTGIGPLDSVAQELGLQGKSPGVKFSNIMDALGAAHMSSGELGRISFEGNAKADLTIHLVDKHGNEVTVVEKKGVPISVIPKQTFPTKKGKPGARKGSGK